MSKNKDRRWSLRKPELPPEQEVDTSLMDTVQFAAIKTEPDPEVKYAEPAPAAESAPPAEPVSSSLEDELPNWMPEWAAKEPGEPAKDYHYDASAYQEYYEDHPDDPDLSSLNLEKAYEQDQEFRQTFRTRDEFRTNPQYDAAAANAEPEPMRSRRAGTSCRTAETVCPAGNGGRPLSPLSFLPWHWR